MCSLQPQKIKASRYSIFCFSKFWYPPDDWDLDLPKEKKNSKIANSYIGGPGYMAESSEEEED